MTLEEQNELINIIQKWINEERHYLDDANKIDHMGTASGYEDIGCSLGLETAIADLSKFIRKYSLLGRVEYIRKLMEENK